MSWREHINEQGFAIIENFLPAGSLDPLTEQLADATLRRSRAGIRHALAHDAVAALARSPQLLGLAEQILGGSAIPFHATLFDKSPKANWLVTWHQDTALPLRSRQDTPGWGPWSVKDGVIYAHAPALVLSRVLALRVHLDDSTEQNGPLRVLPRTHKLDVLSDRAIHKLAGDVPPTTCLVSRGGILAMRPLLVHASSKSQIEVPRRVLHIEYAASLGIAEGLELAIA
ncbi:MAG TPA: phytanoyl-CoA dioxygenase family protein [Candidatus Acidoferrales bacterium]|nr:phytanoyl-CoA dioxygenase family protein [Candidatus Acidoferrales bacterium]